MKQLAGKKKWYWITTGTFTGLIIGLLASAGLYLAFQNISAASLALAFSAIGAVYSFKRFQNWGFEIKEDHLYIEHGVLEKTYSMVPYVRVQHIDTDRGPFDRLIGLSNLRVYTAGSRGADIKIPGLERTEASEIQKKLRDYAIESEKGFDAV